jgi:hypothetical protein
VIHAFIDTFDTSTVEMVPALVFLAICLVIPSQHLAHPREYRIIVVQVDARVSVAGLMATVVVIVSILAWGWHMLPLVIALTPMFWGGAVVSGLMLTVLVRIVVHARRGFVGIAAGLPFARVLPASMLLRSTRPALWIIASWSAIMPLKVARLVLVVRVSTAAIPSGCLAVLVFVDVGLAITRLLPAAMSMRTSAIACRSPTGSALVGDVSCGVAGLLPLSGGGRSDSQSG